MFTVVANELNLQVQEEIVLPFGQHEYVAKVKVAGIPKKNETAIETREFCGDFALTKPLAIDSAYNQILTYLDTAKIIAINDYHHSELTKTSSELFAAET